MFLFLDSRKCFFLFGEVVDLVNFTSCHKARSSANCEIDTGQCFLTTFLVILAGRSWMSKLNSVGARTVPCAIPQVKVLVVETADLYLTKNFLFNPFLPGYS